MAGAAGDHDTLAGICELMFHQYGTNSILYLSEVDHSSTGVVEYDFPSFQVLRHLPRKGFAMAFVIPNHLIPFMRCNKWRNRCGLLCFRLPCNSGGAVATMICGHHGGHADELNQSLSDLACLLRKQPFGRRVVVTGDHNIDVLPAHPCDPWMSWENRYR